MEGINFEEYFEYMLGSARGRDEYWLEDWILGTLEDYKCEEKCSQCGSKINSVVDVYSKTKNYVLEENKICSKCGFVMNRKDLRDKIRKQLQLGNVRVKDVKILEEELA
jgi:flavoprotein